VHSVVTRVIYVASLVVGFLAAANLFVDVVPNYQGLQQQLLRQALVEALLSLALAKWFYLRVSKKEQHLIVFPCILCGFSALGAICQLSYAFA